MFDTCLILAGGRGSRLSTFTKYKPKPLVQVNNVPFLAYLIEHLHSHGIHNIIILSGYLGEQYNQFVHRYRNRVGLSVRNFITPPELNTQARVFSALESGLIRGHVLVCYGDVYSDIHLGRYFEFYTQTSFTSLSISALSRHSSQFTHPYEYKDIGFHATTFQWLKAHLTSPLDQKFETWLWSNSKNKYTFKDHWTYGSLTDDVSLASLESKLSEKVTLALDRDGVINIPASKGSYITSPSDLQLNLPFIAALHDFKGSISRIAIVTNQPWVNSSPDNISKHSSIQDVVIDALKTLNVPVEYLYCPHSYSDSCHCRKPKTGLFIPYVIKHQVLRRKVVVVGDQVSDATFAHSLGDVSFIGVQSNNHHINHQKLGETIQSKLCSDHRYYRLCGLPHGRFDY